MPAIYISVRDILSRGVTVKGGGFARPDVLRYIDIQKGEKGEEYDDCRP